MQAKGGQSPEYSVDSVAKQRLHSTKLERLLKDTEKQYRSLLDSQLIGVAISDGSEQIYRVNAKFLNIIGFTQADFEAGNLSWSKITPVRYDRIDRIKLEELTAFYVVDLFEKEYIHKRGLSIPVVVGAELISEEPPLNISIVLDVSEQKKAEQEKDDMISIIAHEIKTPLSVLRVHADLLYREAKTGTSLKKILKTLKDFDSYILQIDNILSEIITYHKIRDRVSATKPVEFNVTSAVKKVVSDIKLISDRKIVIERAERNCLVCGNETEIREVIINLISNALRYSPKDTTVRVAVWCEDEVVSMSVTDSGRGIAKSEQKRIFMKSYQTRHNDGESENGSMHNGSSRGLGLYLCRQIARRHGGKITVESELNQGSTFTFALPAGVCPID